MKLKHRFLCEVCMRRSFVLLHDSFCPDFLCKGKQLIEKDLLLITTIASFGGELFEGFPPSFLSEGVSARQTWQRPFLLCEKQAQNINSEYPFQRSAFLIQALLPHFGPSSRIVNISSEGARQGQTAPVTLLYSATKAALESMTRVWADALGTRPGMEGTTVNSLIVGVTKTGDTATGLPEGLPDIEPVREMVRAKKSACSVGERLGEVDDVADVVDFLCSEKSRWVSGSAVSANGGAVKIL
ncbi:hypothetical protein F5883DRAFT_721417 [Diaporthe sp. PMI_573]|nr:hypothetical protein F5883DRAFT_721417 [Diaporthaceae sp. PMI_573]